MLNVMGTFDKVIKKARCFAHLALIKTVISKNIYKATILSGSVHTPAPLVPMALTRTQ